jgi:hypothetical protein
MTTQRIPNGGGDEKLIIPPPPYWGYTGPNYQGFVFGLLSSIGKPTHGLTIATQTNEHIFEQAVITGSWYPADDPSAGKPYQGLITGNGDAISCTWTTSNGYNVLQGTLTYKAAEFNVFPPPPQWVPPSAYLDGDVTAYDANGNVIQGAGPGPVSGKGVNWNWWP